MQQDDDQSGFFYGVPLDTLLNKVTLGNSWPLIFDFIHPNTDTNTVFVPYKHLQLNDKSIQTLFGSHPVPTLTGTNFGDLCLTMQHPLGVSTPIHPSKFIFAKIDILASIDEHKFSDSTIFNETMLTGLLNPINLDVVQKIAVDIIKAAVASSAQVTQEIKDIVVTHSSRWPIVKHEHEIVK